MSDLPGGTPTFTVATHSTENYAVRLSLIEVAIALEALKWLALLAALVVLV